MRCIAHVDMDCFYAQVECLRLGYDCRTEPFILVQWGALIAVNYPARALGIRRLHDNLNDARDRCPDVKFCYSPTYRVGETTTHYHPNPQRHTHKVSLQPYREASRKIFDILRYSEPGVEIEKGGFDEAFLDVTEAATMELARLQSEGRPLDALEDVLAPETKLIADRSAEMEAFFASRGTTLERVYDAPMRALKRGEAWPEGEGSRSYCVRSGRDSGGGLRAEEVAEAEANCLLLCAATRVVARLRARIYTELHYDCSAGIAHNRLLAKCISAAHKPHQQTLLLPDRGASALFDLPLDKVRGFGGKLGDAVREICGDGAVLCRDVWLTPLSRLQIIGSALIAGDDGEAEMNSGREPLDDAPMRDSPRFHLGNDALAKGARHTTDMAAAHHVFYRMRGFDTDTVKARIMSKSLIAMKHFTAPTLDLAEVLPWVTVLAAELEDRYRDFVSYYRCKGRTFNVKVGTGFLETADVYNHTVALPEIVSAETLLRVATRELKQAFAAGVRDGRRGTVLSTNASPTFGVPIESVTLTIGGITPSTVGRAARAGVGEGSGPASWQPTQQSTLARFFADPQARTDRKRQRTPPHNEREDILEVLESVSSVEGADDTVEGREATTAAATAVRMGPSTRAVVDVDSEGDELRLSDGVGSSVVELSQYHGAPPHVERFPEHSTREGRAPADRNTVVPGDGVVVVASPSHSQCGDGAISAGGDDVTIIDD